MKREILVFLASVAISIVSVVLFLIGFPVLLLFFFIPPVICVSKKTIESSPLAEEILVCSRCGAAFPASSGYDYCPFCGARLKNTGDSWH